MDREQAKYYLGLDGRYCEPTNWHVTENWGNFYEIRPGVYGSFFESSLEDRRRCKFYHVFITDPEQREKWASQTGRNNNSLHFVEGVDDDMEKIKEFLGGEIDELLLKACFERKLWRATWKGDGIEKIEQIPLDQLPENIKDLGASGC